MACLLFLKVRFTRRLSAEHLGSRHLWMSIKPLAYAPDDATLIFDDSILKKPFSDENTLNCWCWDHS